MMFFSSKAFRLALVSTVVLNFVVNVSPAFSMDSPLPEDKCNLASHPHSSSTAMDLNTLSPEDKKFYEFYDLRDVYKAAARKGDNEAIGKLALHYAHNPDRHKAVYAGEVYAMTAISQGIEDGIRALRETFTIRYNRSGKNDCHKYHDDLAQYCDQYLKLFERSNSKQESIRAWAHSHLFPQLEDHGWEPEAIIQSHSICFPGVKADYRSQ